MLIAVPVARVSSAALPTSVAMARPPDGAQLKAGEDNGLRHEWWHQFDEKKNESLHAHVHMKMFEHSGGFDAITGADGRIKTGRIMEVIAESIEFTKGKDA